MHWIPVFDQDKELQYINLYYTVPSTVKKEIKPPGLHYGWHLQVNLGFYQDTLRKTNNKTTKPRQSTGQRN